MRGRRRDFRVKRCCTWAHQWKRRNRGRDADGRLFVVANERRAAIRSLTTIFEPKQRRRPHETNAAGFVGCRKEHRAADARKINEGAGRFEIERRQILCADDALGNALLGVTGNGDGPAAHALLVEHENSRLGVRGVHDLHLRA